MPVRSDSISRAFRFADVAIHSADAGSESEVFLRTIQIVRNDLEMVERLLGINSVQATLAYLPERHPWIRTAVDSTTSALDEIGTWVEHMSNQRHTKALHHSHQLRYILADSERIANRKTELTACHRQLSNVLSFLNRLDDLSTQREPPAYRNSIGYDDHKMVPQKDIKWAAASTEAITYNIAKTQEIPSKALEIGCTSPLNSYQHKDSSIQPSRQSTSILPYPLVPMMPSSPPPSYSNLHTQRSHQDLRKYTDYKADIKRSLSDPKTIAPRTIPSKPALPYSSRHTTIAELEGDAVYAMSGTNAAGPVNPFALHSTSPPAKPAASRRADEKRIPELAGDMNIPAELAADTTNMPSSNHTLNLAFTRRDIKQRASCSDISTHYAALPRRTTRARHSTLISELEDTTTTTTTTANTKTTTATAMTHISELEDTTTTTARHELPSHPAHRKPLIPHIILHPASPVPTRSTLSHALVSTSPRPSPRQGSRLGPRWDSSSSPHGTNTNTNSNANTAALPNKASKASDTPDPPPSKGSKTSDTAQPQPQSQHQQQSTASASGRVRRQKYMLDLLASIEA
ncbi:hypothetical protein ACJQWK_03977 [Exserohilum turcicum]